MSSFRDRSNEISRLAQGSVGRWIVLGVAAVVVLGLIITGVMESV